MSLYYFAFIVTLSVVYIIKRLLLHFESITAVSYFDNKSAFRELLERDYSSVEKFGAWAKPVEQLIFSVQKKVKLENRLKKCNSIENVLYYLICSMRMISDPIRIQFCRPANW